MRSIGLAVGWVLAAAVLGPLAFGLGYTGWLIASGERFWRADVLTVPLTVLATASFGIPSIIVGVPLFGPLLLLWAVIARRWALLETVGGVIAGTMSMGALAALLLFLLAQRDMRPLAPHGLAVLPEVLQAGGLVWLTLVLPRVVIPPLRPGAFAATRAHAV